MVNQMSETWKAESKALSALAEETFRVSSRQGALLYSLGGGRGMAFRTGSGELGFSERRGWYLSLSRNSVLEKSSLQL